MNEIYILQDIAIIFAMSVATLFISHRLHLPPIVGFLLAGLAIGPYGLRLIASVHNVEILAEIGVVLLLFTVGMGFSLKDLTRSKRAVLIGGTLQVILTIGVVFLLLLRFDFAANKAIFAGFLVALSSTAIVLRSLQDKNDLFSAHGRVILSILVFQDVIIVPMLIFIPVLSGQTDNVASSLAILGTKGLTVVLMVILLARYIVPRILHQVARVRSRELFLLSTALICIAVAWATNELGLSLGLGAFLAGLIISESEYSYQALEGVLPFKIVFTSFFFVSIGMLLNISQFLVDTPLILGSAIAVVVLKAAIAVGVALMLGMSSRSAILIGLALSQVGEFSFILSRAGISSGLLDENIYQTFLAVTVVTMAATPFILNIAPRLADHMAGWPFLRIFRQGSYLHLSEEGRQLKLTNHVVIVGFGLNGRNIALAARSANIPYAIIEMNPDTVREMQKQGEPILYGDATGQEVLNHAAIANARIAVIAISDPVGVRQITQNIRRMNPTIYIIVRTRFVTEMPTLYELGADDVIPEEFETSVEIFTRILLKYLIPRNDIDKFTQDIRSHKYEMFRSLAQRPATVGDLQLQVPGIEINAVRLAAGSALIGRTLQEAQLRAKFGVNVLAMVQNQKLVVNPPGSQTLNDGDILYIIGSPDCCSQANRALASLTPAQ